jgi:hypothetical protein
MKSNQTLKIRDRKFSLKTLVASVSIATITSILLTSIYFASLAYLDTLPSTAIYTIETDGVGNYRAIRYDGEQLWESTDASYTINTAISSGKNIIFKEGTFELSNPLSLKHGIILEGMGENTVIKQESGANLDYLIYIYLNTGSSFGRVQLRNFVLDGNKAGQTGGSGYGIYSDTYSSVYSDYVLFQDLYIKDTYGIGIETNGNYYEFDNVYVYGAGSHGFVIRDYHARLVNTVARKNVGDGYLLRGTGLHSLLGVRSLQNNGNGIHLYGIDYGDLRSEIIGGSAMMNDKHGILFEGASNNRIIGVSIEGNSYAIANASDNIHFKSYGSTHSDNNILEGNTIKGNGNVRYQIYEADSNQDYNLVQGNEILDDGQTGKILVQGSNSKVKNNIGFVTENSGMETIANNEYIAHGLATSLNIGTMNSIVLVTPYTSVYDGVPVVAGSNFVNGTHIRVSAYWTNRTAITDDAVQIWWSVEYKP